MQSALERRQSILEVLSSRRSETIANLMAEFNVSRSTIIRDIQTLSASAPLYTITGRYGGGIRVADGWYIGRQCLHKDQEELLRRLKDGLQPDEQKLMQSILDSFAMPKIPRR